MRPFPAFAAFVAILFVGFQSCEVYASDEEEKAEVVHDFDSEVKVLQEQLQRAREAGVRLGINTEDFARDLDHAERSARYMLRSKRPPVIAVTGPGNAGSSMLAAAIVRQEFSRSTPHPTDPSQDRWASFLIPKGEDASQLFPTVEGWRWMFQVTSGGHSVTKGDDEQKFVLVDAPSYGYEANSEFLSELSFFSNYSIVVVPENYYHSGFVEYLKEAQQLGTKIVLVFNRRMPQYRDLSSVEYSKIVSTIAKAAGVRVHSASVMNELESSDDSLSLAPVGRPDEPLPALEWVEQFSSDTKVVEESQREKLREMKLALERIVAHFEGFGRHFAEIGATLQASQATVPIDESAAKGALSDALGTVMKNSMNPKDRFQQFVDDFAKKNLLKQLNAFQAGRIVQETAHKKVERKRSFQEAEIRTFKAIHRKLIVALKKLRDSGAFSGPIQESLDRTLDPENVLIMQQRLQDFFRGKPLVTSEVQSELSRFVTFLKNEKPDVYAQFKRAEGLEYYLNAGTEFALVKGAPVVIMTTTSLLLKSMFTGLIGSVGAAVWGYAVAPKIISHQRATANAAMGNAVMARNRKEVQKSASSKKAAPVEAEEGEEIVLSDVEQEAEWDGDNLYSLQIKSRAELFVQFLQANTLKDLISTMKTVNQHTPTELLEDLSQSLSCAGYLNPKG